MSVSAGAIAAMPTERAPERRMPGRGWAMAYSAIASWLCSVPVMVAIGLSWEMSQGTPIPRLGVAELFQYLVEFYVDAAVVALPGGALLGLAGWALARRHVSRGAYLGAMAGIAALVGSAAAMVMFRIFMPTMWVHLPTRVGFILTYFALGGAIVGAAIGRVIWNRFMRAAGAVEPARAEIGYIGATVRGAVVYLVAGSALIAVGSFAVEGRLWGAGELGGLVTGVLSHGWPWLLALGTVTGGLARLLALGGLRARRFYLIAGGQGAILAAAVASILMAVNGRGAEWAEPGTVALSLVACAVIGAICALGLGWRVRRLANAV